MSDKAVRVGRRDLFREAIRAEKRRMLARVFQDFLARGAAVDRGLGVEGNAIVAAYMGAGPSAMYASHALGAFNQFAKAKTKNANI